MAKRIVRGGYRFNAQDPREYVDPRLASTDSLSLDADCEAKLVFDTSQEYRYTESVGSVLASYLPLRSKKVK